MQKITKKHSLSIIGSGLIGFLVPPFLLVICVTLLTACTPRDLALEETLSVKLERFKSSKALTMDLNNVLSKNWRKVCVQWPYAIEETFNELTGEQVGRLLDISENEMVLWIFYNDGSVRTAVIERNVMDFILPRKFVSLSRPCASPQNPHIYAFGHNSVRDFFYFRKNKK